MQVQGVDQAQTGHRVEVAARRTRPPLEAPSLGFLGPVALASTCFLSIRQNVYLQGDHPSP